MVVIIVAWRVVLGCVFVYAGIRKLINFNGFVNAIKSFGFPPQSIVLLLARAVPFVECLAGGALLLLSGYFIPLAALTLLGLLLLFSLALTIAWWQQRVVVCHCFGGDEGEGEASVPTAYLPALVRNSVLLIGALIVLLSPAIFWDPLLSTFMTSTMYRDGIFLAVILLSSLIAVRSTHKRFSRPAQLRA